MDALDFATVEIRQNAGTSAAYLGSWLQGRWAPVHDDAQYGPWLWDASGEILESWSETKGQAKYGQCWVFAGLLQPTFSALGMTTRTVTNFDPAHDHLREKGTNRLREKGSNRLREKGTNRYWQTAPDGTEFRLEAMTADSVWSYHVWTDIDVKRDEKATTTWSFDTYGEPEKDFTPPETKTKGKEESVWNFHVWSEITMDGDGDIIDRRSGSIAGNFHVWTEVWMTSPEAPKGDWHAVELEGISYPTLLRTTKGDTKTKISYPTLLKTKISMPTLLKSTGISYPTLNKISMPTLATSLPLVCE